MPVGDGGCLAVTAQPQVPAGAGQSGFLILHQTVRARRRFPLSRRV